MISPPTNTASMNVKGLLQAGYASLQKGDHAGAAVAFRQLLAASQQAFQAHAGLAQCAQAAGKAPDALAHWQEAVRLRPDMAELQAEYGMALIHANRIEDAAAAFRAALALNPALYGTAYNLGNALAALGKPGEALAPYRQAIAHKPDFAEAHFNLGLAHFKLGQTAEALAAYRAAFALNAGLPKIADTLGNLLLDEGRADEAAAVFLRAAEAGTEKLGFLFRAHLLLPRIAESPAQIAAARAHLAKGLDQLMSMDGVIRDPPGLTNDALFYLAYAGENDRPIMEAAHRMFRAHSPVLTHTSPHLADTRAARKAGAGRIRVGFLSQFLCAHTIGRLNQGLIAGLDRARFHVTVIHTAAARRDALRAAIDASADAAVTLPADLAGAQAAVSDLKLDLLHFPDIGMNAFTYFLAYARMAPVQTMGWGHPVTTGTDTIDYFLSFDTAEPAGAETHYAETLVRLARPSVAYVRDDKIARPLPRAEFGLPAEGALYGCLQSLFKFHPDFDAVLADVVARDPTGWIVLIEWVQPTWMRLLRERWARSHPILLERVIVVPRQPAARFQHLVANMDVMIDPLHFGGGNTFYEALAQDVPSVTWPGHYLRGRLITGFYKLLGVEEGLIAATPADLAPRAVALAKDPARRAKVCAPLFARGEALYRDEAAVQELGAFFQAAVAADLKGEKVTAWRFSPPVP